MPSLVVRIALVVVIYIQVTYFNIPGPTCRARAWCCCAPAAWGATLSWENTLGSCTLPGAGWSGTIAAVSEAPDEHQTALGTCCVAGSCACVCGSCPALPCTAFLNSHAASTPRVPSAACRLTMPGPKGHTYLRMGATDEFFNIALERPPKDVKGYDVLFVNVSSGPAGRVKQHNLFFCGSLCCCRGCLAASRRAATKGCPQGPAPLPLVLVDAPPPARSPPLPPPGRA